MHRLVARTTTYDPPLNKPMAFVLRGSSTSKQSCVVYVCQSCALVLWDFCRLRAKGWPYHPRLLRPRVPAPRFAPARGRIQPQQQPAPSNFNLLLELMEAEGVLTMTGPPAGPGAQQQHQQQQQEALGPRQLQGLAQAAAASGYAVPSLRGWASEPSEWTSGASAMDVDASGALPGGLHQQQQQQASAFSTAAAAGAGGLGADDRWSAAWAAVAGATAPGAVRGSSGSMPTHIVLSPQQQQQHQLLRTNSFTNNNNSAPLMPSPLGRDQPAQQHVRAAAAAAQHHHHNPHHHQLRSRSLSKQLEQQVQQAHAQAVAATAAAAAAAAAAASSAGLPASPSGAAPLGHMLPGSASFNPLGGFASGPGGGGGGGGGTQTVAEQPLPSATASVPLSLLPRNPSSGALVGASSSSSSGAPVAAIGPSPLGLRCSRGSRGSSDTSNGTQVGSLGDRSMISWLAGRRVGAAGLDRQQPS